MMRWFPPRVHLVALLVLSALTIWAPHWTKTDRPTNHAVNSFEAAPATVVDLHLIAPITEDDVNLDELVDRPLFAPTRSARPGSEEPEQAQDDPAELVTPEEPIEQIRPPPEVTMLGYVRHHGQTFAVIRNDQNKVEQLIRAGDQLGDWTVSQIHNNELLLRNGDEEISIKRVLD